MDNKELSRRQMIGRSAAAAAGAATLSTAAFGNGLESNPASSVISAESQDDATRQSDYHGKVTPANAAVLLIDYQTNLILGCQSMDHKLLVNNMLALGEIARIYELPVVMTTTGGGGKGPAGPTHPDLTAMFPGVKQIDRQLFFNSMADPVFNKAVKDTGRKKLFIGGITTDLCVVFPAITAVQQGYDVYVVADTCASWTKQIDDISLMRLTQAGVILTNVQSVLAELQNNLSEIDPEAAKKKQVQTLGFYSKYVAPTSLMNGAFFKNTQPTSSGGGL